MSSFYSNEELEQLGLKHFGENVKISRKTSIYKPENISIGNHVRIDDFCILSGGNNGIKIGSYIHIGAFCAIYGNAGVTMEDFSGLSSRVVLYTASDDFSGESLAGPTIPNEYRKTFEGKIILEKHAAIGTNATVLPNVIIGEGAAVGAHSLVTKNLESWGIYSGVPVRRVNKRKQDLLAMEKKLIDSFQKG